MAGVMGSDGARMVQDMIDAANQARREGILPTVLGIAALLLGATGAFGELQSALNRAWEVKPDPRQGGLKGMLLKRLLSLGMAATIAFFLLVSMVVSALLSAFGDRLGARFGSVPVELLQVVQAGISLVTVWALFTLMFKVLPDARTSFKDVAVGAAATTLLFVGGKAAIGFYLAKSHPGSSFGAAGALAVILVWIYYSTMIVFFGAEFTQAWAVERGSGIEPKEGAKIAVGRGKDAAAKPKPARGEPSASYP
jgi:membrane protein